MLTSGPIAPSVHGLLDYVLGALLIVAPFLLGFDDGTATVVSIAAGIAELPVAACTAWSRGIIKLIPPPVHGIIDYVFTIALIVAPLLLGFSDDTTALAFFLTVGVGGLLLVLATRFVSDLPTEGAAQRSSQS